MTRAKRAYPSRAKRLTAALFITAMMVSTALVSIPNATAQSPEQNPAPNTPMTFTAQTNSDNFMSIFAEGDITETTASAFATFLTRTQIPAGTPLHLNSNGGDLIAAMELGQQIRRAQLNTNVAQPTSPSSSGQAINQLAPATCISACTIAYLGGTERHLTNNSLYAVHQVSLPCANRDTVYTRYPWLPLPTVLYCPDLQDALSQVQEASGNLIAYVQAMGADPIFLREMARAQPDQINPLSPAQMTRFKITTTPGNQTPKEN